MAVEPIAKAAVFDGIYPFILEQYKRVDTATMIGDTDDEMVGSDGSEMVGDPLSGESKVVGIVRLLAEEYQRLEDAIQEMLPILDVSQMGGVNLDVIGRILNTPRKTSEADAAYRSRLLTARGFIVSGTLEQIISYLKNVYGATSITIATETTGVLVILTDAEVTQGQLESISPAGVGVLKGTPLQTYDGYDILTYDGNQILVVADS